jgi:hypothetical protein
VRMAKSVRERTLAMGKLAKPVDDGRQTARDRVTRILELN